MSMICRSKMQMTHQPDDYCRKPGHKNEKDHPTLPSFFAQRTWPARASFLIEVASVVQRYRDVEPAVADVGFYALFPSLTRRFLRDSRGVRNHPFEFVDLITQLRFPTGSFFLPAAEGWSRSRRTTKHSQSPAGHPEEKSKGNKTKNDQRQSERDANSHPLRKRASAVELVTLRRNIR